jgi:hypothetical protein
MLFVYLDQKYTRLDLRERILPKASFSWTPWGRGGFFVWSLNGAGV